MRRGAAPIPASLLPQPRWGFTPQRDPTPFGGVTPQTPPRAHKLSDVGLRFGGKGSHRAQGVSKPGGAPSAPALCPPALISWRHFPRCAPRVHPWVSCRRMGHDNVCVCVCVCTGGEFGASPPHYIAAAPLQHRAALMQPSRGPGARSHRGAPRPQNCCVSNEPAWVNSEM